MGLKQKIKNVPALYNTILFFLNSIDYFNRRFRREFPGYQLTPHWLERISVVKLSPDNQKIAHVPGAGTILHDHQLMANGLKIVLGSYYDYGNSHLLRDNRGVHEPQEEYAFETVLSSIPEGGVMMELGSYWAFYSMWFAKKINNSRNIMIEPDPHKMNFGKLNFQLNSLKGTFDLGFISDRTDLKPSIPFYSVDHLMQKHAIDHLAILHSDIQGFELKMLSGAREAMRSGKIDYFFISTHSEEIHKGCMTELREHHYSILCEADLKQSYSVDGLIVAKREGVAGPEQIEISKRG